MAAEKVLQTQDVATIKNGYKLPVFFTAGCEIGRFDNVNMDGKTIAAQISLGEAAFVNPDGGAIALVTTTRDVNGPDNFSLGTGIFNHVFEKDANGQRKRLGDVVKEAKNELGNEINKLEFVLLGDPAMPVFYPEYKVVTDSINGKPVNEQADSLKAFGKVTVSAHVTYDDSTLIRDFNGFAYPRVYDKPVQVVTLGNDDETPFTYTDQNNILYKGKATIKNGQFKFSFIMPKDISYIIGKGKISYYAENGKIDAQGGFTNVNIGGTSENYNLNENGPEIRLFMNDTLFKDGDFTNSNPFLLGLLSDENGINTTGIGIGHDLSAVIDNEDNNPQVLNDYFQANTDDYTKGSVNYPLINLQAGEHSILLKAWDVFNNSSEATINFVVNTSDGFVVDKLINYPNPATETTTFQYLHNAPGEVHEIRLEVFDISGRLVAAKTRKMFEDGFVSTPLEWDLKTASGNYLQTGIYPYQIKIKTSLGTSFLNNKLIIIR